LHIGRLTTSIPAFATRSSVSSARASSCTDSEQQWPTTTRPSKPGLDLELRDVAEGLDARVHRLVHVEIGIQPARGSLREKPLRRSRRSGTG
jgi:hypothetical protein